MSTRELRLSSPRLIQDSAGLSSGKIVVLWPLGGFESHQLDRPLGAMGIIVEKVCLTVRQELNSSAPEVATWWQLPCLDLTIASDALGALGAVGLRSETLASIVAEVSQSTCRWANSLTIVTARPDDCGAIGAAVARVRAEGHDVTWLDLDLGLPSAADPSSPVGVLLAYLAPEFLPSTPPKSQTERGARAFASVVDDVLSRLREGHATPEGQLVSRAQ